MKEVRRESVERLHGGKHKSEFLQYRLSVISAKTAKILLTTLCALVFPQELLVLLDYTGTKRC